MKKERKFYFKKYIKIINYYLGDHLLDTSYEYKTISNSSIIKKVINLIDYNNIIDWYFDDFDYCWVEIKTTKEDYFKFCMDFIDVFDGYMEYYKFNK